MKTLSKLGALTVYMSHIGAVRVIPFLLPYGAVRYIYVTEIVFGTKILLLQPIVLAPNDFANIKANVKVASTENGIIFGNIVYDILGAGSDRNVVVLNDIHIDIMDYIVPASCTETEFRSMWAEFEWENKV